MSAWTGTRVPAKTGVPLRMSGDDVTMGGAMAVTLLSSGPLAQGSERWRSAAGGEQRERPGRCTAQFDALSRDTESKSYHTLQDMADFSLAEGDPTPDEHAARRC